MALKEYEEILQYGDRNPEACQSPVGVEGFPRKGWYLSVSLVSESMGSRDFSRALGSAGRFAHWGSPYVADVLGQVVDADVNMSMELKLCAEMVRSSFLVGIGDDANYFSAQVGLLPTKLARLAKRRSR